MRLSKAIKTMERRKAYLMARADRPGDKSYDKAEAAAIMCVLDRLKEDNKD